MPVTLNLPTILAKLADGRSIDAGARAVEAFRQLVTTLRLYKSGGVGIGPYAWTRAGEHRWRRIATGDAIGSGYVWAHFGSITQYAESVHHLQNVLRPFDRIDVLPAHFYQVKQGARG